MTFAKQDLMKITAKMHQKTC